METVVERDLAALKDEILAGRCVAFVGAGFSAAAGAPTWVALLARVIASTTKLSDEDGRYLGGLLATNTAHSLDQAAQFLEDKLTRPVFQARMREALGSLEPSLIEGRRKALAGIPFRAILTTNFDNLLQGVPPEAGAYRQVLRCAAPDPWSLAFWGPDQPTSARGEPTLVVKLHGDLEADRDNVVFTRRDYRRHLYEQPGYAAFLRSVFASYTILYLGFSFSDAYLNELRSEVLALLGCDRAQVPVAYAVLPDVDPRVQAIFRKHEGIQVLTYAVDEDKRHTGFDRILDRLHDLTNPVPRFARLVAGKRLLWVDSHPENNAEGLTFITKAAREASKDAPVVEMVPGAAEALARLNDRASPPIDLVITHWGRDATPPTAVHVLTKRPLDERAAPVVVFTSRASATRGKREALALGARAICCRWEDLFREIDHAFADADTSA